MFYIFSRDVVPFFKLQIKVFVESFLINFISQHALKQPRRALVLLLGSSEALKLFVRLLLLILLLCGLISYLLSTFSLVSCGIFFIFFIFVLKGEYLFVFIFGQYINRKLKLFELILYLLSLTNSIYSIIS